MGGSSDMRSSSYNGHFTALENDVITVLNNNKITTSIYSNITALKSRIVVNTIQNCTGITKRVLAYVNNKKVRGGYWLGVQKRIIIKYSY